MAESMPDKLDSGLSNPFSGPGGGFFAGGDRRHHLEQLRHLSKWPRRVLLVTGSQGVGKTSLYRQLSASLEPRVKAARINGALVSSAREVLQAMVQGFGIPLPAEASVHTLAKTLREHADAQQESERYCVALVDDAELLEAKALEQLLALASGSSIKVVLFGEVRLVPALERLAGDSDLGWQEIRLTGFGPGDVKAYLEWRFRELGVEGRLPFSDTEIRDIARLSEGVPARIDQMANVLLARIQTGQLEGQHRRFPALHKALLGVLVLGLALAYLLWRPAEQPASPPDAERIALPERALKAPAAVDEPGVDEPTPGDIARMGDAAGTDAAASLEMAEEPALAPAAALEPPGAVDEADVSEPAAVADVKPAPKAAPAEAPKSEAVTLPEETAAVASAPERPAAAETPTEAPAEAADVPEPVRPAAQAAQSPAAAAQPSRGESPKPEGARTARWILGQPADAYTLQLASFSTPERAASYLSAQRQPDDFASYRLQRDGRILHVVIYGVYADRSAAEAAARSLPATVGDVKPWIRTFAQVQEAARTALQQ